MKVEIVKDTSEIISSAEAEPAKTELSESKTSNNDFVEVKEGQAVVDIEYMKKLADEAKRHRKAKAEAKARELAALESNNEYKKMAELLKLENDEKSKMLEEMKANLTTSADAVNNWNSYTAKVQIEVEAKIDTLADDEKAILDSIDDIFTKQKLINKFTQKKQITAPDLGKTVSAIDNIKPKKRSLF